ncbi:MAG: DUF4160 domain-containing protein [Solirubrobacteraceae bacterium]
MSIPDATYQRVLRDRRDDVPQRSRTAALPRARYGEYEAQIVIETGEPLAGYLPIRALRLIREWASLREAELQADWELAQARAPLASIDPLP